MSMRILYAPSLRDEDVRLLEDDLLEVADGVGATDVDVAAAPGLDPVLDLVYADGRADDAALRAIAGRIVSAFNARPASPGRRRVTLRIA